MTARILVAVWNARYDRTELYPEREARDGMRRWAATLGAGTDARAAAEDFARDGDLAVFPPLRPAWIPEPSS